MAINKTFLNIALVLSMSIPILMTAGCAEINPLDAPQKVLNNPLGTDLIRIGMTKQQVTSIWGKPDQVNNLKPADEWQTPREEWVYMGRYTKVPINKSYLFKTKYLVFDGNNLVCVGDKSQYKVAGPEKFEL